ncbi:MAG: hypothetical protein ILA19_03210 [Bacilli bacterium]|nr:hypothetical protein [Bacilli bacterium]
MLLFIVFAIVLALAIGLLFLKEKFDWDSVPYTVSFIVGAVFTIIGGIAVIICSTMAIIEHIPSVRHQIKNGIEQQIEEIQSDYNYIQTITDDKARSVAVVEYNKQVRDFKTTLLAEQYALDNLWINWYSCPEFGNYDVDVVVYIK